jgi:SAM-dependent methyltransferase
MSTHITRECGDARARAFDELAGSYDETFTHTAVGTVLREMVWTRLEDAFRDSRCILDIGCGTGEDAVRLARNGMQVIATDASSRMIQVAQQKTSGCVYAGRVEFRRMAMEDLSVSLEGKVFDGALSNFGAINCAQNLPSLIASVAARLTPGAPLCSVVMGRHVPWEWMWFLIRGDWRRALRRLRTGGVSWRGMTISYPTPARMASLLRPHFAVRRVTALGFALPPSYAAAWLERSPRALRALTRVERLAQRWSALAALSDHYIVEATRLPESAGA